jgi:tetratricopeptide (TPR) repeat protein
LDNIGAIFGLRRQYDSALFYMNKALTLNPGNISSYKNRGLVNIELKRNEDALNDFKKILEFSPGDPDIMNMVGVCYLNLGKYDEALTTITQAISIKPDPRFYLNRAYSYVGLRNIELARKDAEIAKQGGVTIDAALAKSLE